jgi:hypothetical protein
MAPRSALLVLLVALAASSAFAATPAGRSGRMLLQSGVSCPAQIPACTARRCTTRILDSVETYVCLRCQRGYVPVKGSDGKSVVQCGECRPCCLQLHHKQATAQCAISCFASNTPAPQPEPQKLVTDLLLLLLLDCLLQCAHPARSSP